jgi:hypothetical protein
MDAWIYASMAAALYCLVRGIVDLRERRFVWAALGIVSGLVLMLTPIRSHAVKYDLLNDANAER